MTEEQFGSCPECGKAGGYRNIYKQHFFYCDEHRLVWLAGSNLFSTWRDENEGDWRAAWEHLREYRTVDGFEKCVPGAPLGEQVTLAELLPTPDPGEGEVADLEEDLRQLSTTVEQEQLERQISGNLTPADEERIDLREERLRREAEQEAGVVDEVKLNARAETIWKGMPPKMRDRLADIWMKRCIREFMDKMVSEGRAEHDADTGSYRMIGEAFPPADMKDFIEEKLREES